MRCEALRNGTCLGVATKRGTFLQIVRPGVNGGKDPSVVVRGMHSGGLEHGQPALFGNTQPSTGSLLERLWNAVRAAGGLRRGGSTANSPPPAVTPPPPPPLASADAARLLEQATFGVTASDLTHVQSIGIDAYINEQLAYAPTQYSGFSYTSAYRADGLQERRLKSARCIESSVRAINTRRFRFSAHFSRMR